MIEYLLNLSTQPIWVFISIVLASYVLEDLAIVGAAVMAADHMIPVPLALYAILVGIITGDIGLYVLGYLLKNNKTFLKWLEKKNRQQHYDAMFSENLIKNILLIRFVPGLRLVCYTSCGLFKAHFGQFVLGVTIACVAWVLFVFTLIYQLGSSAWLELSDWKWLLIPLAILFLYMSNRRIMRSLKQQETAA